MAKLKLSLTIVFAFLFAVPVVAEPFVMVVMDPLSGPLSCDCVRGYAQRKYEVLGEHLERSIGRDVEVHWFESLVEAAEEIKQPIDLVIGKDSVVRADAETMKQSFEARASLTGKDGSVTQRGLIVVRAEDNAKKIGDLKDYRVLFGPTDAAEKSSAIEACLKSNGVVIDSSRKRFGACSEAVSALVRMPTGEPYAAVISSYAEPLLGGCGVVKKGAVRVVGESGPVPFITAFVHSDLPDATKDDITRALLLAGTNPNVLTQMETLAGFVPYEAEKITPPKMDPKSTPKAGAEDTSSVEKKKPPRS